MEIKSLKIYDYIFFFFVVHHFFFFIFNSAEQIYVMQKTKHYRLKGYAILTE